MKRVTVYKLIFWAYVLASSGELWWAYGHRSCH